jgi:hypothetical protein
MPGTYTRTVTIDANSNSSGSPDYSWVVVPASAQKTNSNPSGWVELSAASGSNGSSTDFVISDNTGSGATSRSCVVKAQHWNYANDNSLEASFTIYQSAAGETTTTSSTTTSSTTTTSTSTTTEPPVYSITFSGTGSTISDPVIFDGNNPQGQLITYTLSGGSGQAQYVSGRPSYLTEQINLQNVSLQLSSNTADWPTAGESFEIQYQHSLGGNTDSIYGQFTPVNANTIFLDISHPQLIANPGNAQGTGKMAYTLDMSSQSTTSTVSLGVQLDPDVDLDTLDIFWSTSSTGATSATTPYWINNTMPYNVVGMDIDNVNGAYGGSGDTYQSLVTFEFADPNASNLPTGSGKNEPYVEEGAVAQSQELVGDEGAGTMYLIIQNPNDASNYASVYVTAPSGALTTSTTTTANGTFALQYSNQYIVPDTDYQPNVCSGNGSAPTNKFRIGGTGQYQWAVLINYTSPMGTVPNFFPNITRPVGVANYPCGNLTVTFNPVSGPDSNGNGTVSMVITTPAQTGSGCLWSGEIDYHTIAVSASGFSSPTGAHSFYLHHQAFSC